MNGHSYRVEVRRQSVIGDPAPWLTWYRVHDAEVALAEMRRQADVFDARVIRSDEVQVCAIVANGAWL